MFPTLEVLPGGHTATAGPAQLAHQATQEGEIVVGEAGPLEQGPQLGHAGPGGVGMEEAHLQQQRFGIGQASLDGTTRGEFLAPEGLIPRPVGPLILA